jgi:exopolyphosphatase/guanosine-5'-triphosphate,3'-diphosphate pyrophosphatase
MYAAFCELEIEQMQPATGALREGVLYDLLGRCHDNDMRDITVQQLMQRYRVDVRQAKRVVKLSHSIAQQLLGEDADAGALRVLDWTANLHEIGISVAHNGYHKHSAYILANADMPGFSKQEQARLSLLALAHRGSLDKLPFMDMNVQDTALVMSLRLATLFYRNRSDAIPPALIVHFSGTKFYLALNASWLAANPATTAALQEEVRLWQALKISITIQPK